MSDLDELFAAIREAASSASWSQGVELARAGAVCGESEEDGELVLRVATRGGLVSPSVALDVAGRDWDCTCASPEEVCAHAAAAVIALRRARREGRSLPEIAGGRARVGYRLARSGAGLALERALVLGDGEQPLTSSLVAVASGRAAGPEIVATPEDVAVERALGPRLRGPMPRGLLVTLCERLSGCPDVTLDGHPVRTSPEPVGLGAVLDDDGEGFRLAVRRDPRIRATFDDTLALLDDTLHPLAASQLTGRELDELARGRHFAPDQVAELVTDVLPSLSSRIAVEIRTKRLPRTVREVPRLRIEVGREGDALRVLPTLVYGNPPIARVDAGRLTPLGGPVPLRDEAEERRLARRLQSELSLLPGHALRLRGESAVALAGRLRQFGSAVVGDAHHAFTRAPALTARIEVGPRDFALSFEARVGGERRTADPAAVLRAWRAGDGLVPLTGGGFSPLPADWLARFGDRVADLLAARRAGDRGGLPRCALFDLAELCDDLGQPPPAALAALRAQLSGDSGLPAAELPADLAASLRDYQRRGVDWLQWLRGAGLGALLADDMGLGKTLQALCAVRGRTLVVAPTSVIHNWADEAARFRPSLRCALYHGAGRRLDPGADLTLTSYAILRLDADALAAVRWDTVVLDESQRIKNPDSQVARAAYRLDADFRIALTGTPVENRLDELWSQLHCVARGLLGSRRDFEERYARPVASGDADAAERLRRRIRPFVLRRVKDEVAPELPPRTEIVLHAELSDDERRGYDAIRAATRRDVVERLAAGGGVLAALEALLRLRQAACHPALLPGGRAESSAKLDLLLEQLDEVVAEGHKALVFSQWTRLLDLAEPVLRTGGLDYGRLDGATRDRAGVVARFQDAAGPPVLLVSLTAGGVGLNLTAADHVFILDPWWNPAVEDQAADRAHRIGQDRPVMIYRLVAEDTVEERILALQRRKRELSEAALGAGDAATALNREELLALLD